MEQYFITLHSFTNEEYEVWKQLNKRCNYDTNIVGYTVNQLVYNSDKRLSLTARKVGSILKKFEEKGYTKIVSRGGKGRESTLEITIRQQLFNNNQESKPIKTKEVNNTSNNNSKVCALVINYLNEKVSTNYKPSTKSTQSFINARIKEGYTVEDFKKVIDGKSKEWIGTEWEKYLRPSTLFSNKFENYLVQATKKNNSNPAKANRKYLRGVEML